MQHFAIVQLFQLENYTSCNYFGYMFGRETWNGNTIKLIFFLIYSEWICIWSCRYNLIVPGMCNSMLSSRINLKTFRTFCGSRELKHCVPVLKTDTQQDKSSTLQPHEIFLTSGSKCKGWSNNWQHYGRKKHHKLLLTKKWQVISETTGETLIKHKGKTQNSL